MARALSPSASGGKIESAMNDSLRWLALAVVLGFAAAYALWGRGTKEAPVDAGPPEAAHGAGAFDRPPLPEGPQSRLVLEPPVWERDNVEPGSHNDLSFTVKNPGDRTIRIITIKPSCGCVKPRMDTQIIKPGEHAELKAIYRAGKDKLSEEVGILLETDEPGSPKLQAMVKAKLHHVLWIEPKALSFGTLEPGQEAKRFFTVRQPDGKPFVLKGFSCSRPEFTFNAKPMPGSNNSKYYVEVTCKGGTEHGTLTEQVGMVTDLPGARVVSATLMTEVLGTVVAMPKAFVYAQMPDGSLPPLATTLSRKQPGPLKVLNVRDSLKRPFDWSAKPEGDKIKLEFHFKSPLPKDKPLQGAFLLELEGESPLSVPYTIMPPINATPQDER
ncbi:MAG: DUF1573 domain-containing protein [Planctomycetes bacterium]|nr:DUF1573 domain-containing protein [Planctomycetota bacterium]